ncbi:SDR family NAD(P)-dependent oxidoreductase [Lentzea cavernae]|uniref:Short-chain dehydrogenase n=1 Tax=Lentzea cavernae TaxID=2020703 RepID=A0ABQ3MCW6_9PSEU|nr:SDR family oxidoreductase [Lentzea cavernae]GHH39871.1 short-chain dehydrogenase [Lentzea cavernae]
MTTSSDFDGRSVVITGAGSGIGRAAALQFARAGAKVVLADVNAEAVKTVAEEVVAAAGVAVAVAGDLTEPGVVGEVVATAVNSFGGLDALVCNAGIMDSMSAAADVSDDEWDRLLGVNLTAPFRLTRAALPHLLARKGAIVYTASEASLRGSAAGAAYTAAKTGLVGLMRSVAVTYRDAGLRANAVAPGGTRTGISASPDPAALGPQVVGRYLPNMGRVAEAGEPAAAIVFLASPAASNITGVVLPVDNGWSAV